MTAGATEEPSPASSTSFRPHERSLSALDSTHGRTTIADAVVAKMAGIAAREIGGVHALGGGAARTIGALRDRIPGSRPVSGAGSPRRWSG